MLAGHRDGVPRRLQAPRAEPGSYLAVEQLGLRPSIAFDLIADTVEERYAILLLIAPAKLPQHLPRLLCNGKAEPR